MNIRCYVCMAICMTMNVHGMNDYATSSSSEESKTTRNFAHALRNPNSLDLMMMQPVSFASLREVIKRENHCAANRLPRKPEVDQTLRRSEVDIKSVNDNDHDEEFARAKQEMTELIAAAVEHEKQFNGSPHNSDSESSDNWAEQMRSPVSTKKFFGVIDQEKKK